MDAVELLLKDKQHPDAEKLRKFHRRNRTFLLRFVEELLWLKKLGRKGGAKSLVHYLRWAHDWNGVDEFGVNQNLAPLISRVCALLWPSIRGVVTFIDCPADEILGTFVVGSSLRSRKATRDTLKCLPLAPAPQELTRLKTHHPKITRHEAAEIIPFFEDLVLKCSPSSDSTLQAWLQHVKDQPEMFCLMQKKLLTRSRQAFSAISLVEYSKWSIRRAAKSGKRFSIHPRFEGLYCRALIMRHPEFNGLCLFKEDSTGNNRPGIANRLLGTSLSPELINGEPYRRLIWKGSTD